MSTNYNQLRVRTIELHIWSIETNDNLNIRFNHYGGPNLVERGICSHILFQMITNQNDLMK